MLGSAPEYDLFGDPVAPPSRGPVADRFLFPPFSVLDGRSGDWRDRKRSWLAMGIKSEIGRDAGLTFNISLDEYGGSSAVGDTSVFDPVLCELVYRWFAPPGGQVVDPFAGGSVRGIVAAALGLKYWGVDLRAEQVAANREQASALGLDPQPEWVVGDAREMLAGSPPADLVFSCPPYGDLERYSDDPRDLSVMDHGSFLAAHGEIVRLAIKQLRPNRFAAWVTGDFRDGAGCYRNFPAHAVGHFLFAGARLYNEAVLANAVGTGAMRVSKQFGPYRKLVKLHQNLHVFVKGDWRRAGAVMRPAEEIT